MTETLARRRRRDRRSATRRATRSRWRSSATVSIRTTAARCASPATARTASPRSMAWPMCAPARRRRGRGSSSAGTRPSAARRCRRWRSRSTAARSRPVACGGSTPISSSSAAVDSGTEPPPPSASGRRRAWSLDADDGAEVVADLPRPDGDRPHVPPACCTSTPTRSSWRPGAAEIHPVCPGNGLAGILTARAAERRHDAGVDLGDAVAVGEPPSGVPHVALPGGSSASTATPTAHVRPHRRRRRHSIRPHRARR